MSSNSNNISITTPYFFLFCFRFAQIRIVDKKIASQKNETKNEIKKHKNTRQPIRVTHGTFVHKSKIECLQNETFQHISNLFFISKFTSLLLPFKTEFCLRFFVFFLFAFCFFKCIPPHKTKKRKEKRKQKKNMVEKLESIANN